MTKQIINCETDEIIERELNSEELVQQAKDEALIEATKIEAEKKAAARKAILDRLGITEEEARLLLG